MKLDVKTIKRGDKGHLVGIWQTFLRGKGLYRGPLDDDFGGGTEDATLAYEGSCGIIEDGVVDDFLWDVAVAEGLAKSTIAPYKYPSAPDFKPLTFAQRQKQWGEILFTPARTKGNPEAVHITNGWGDKVANVDIPQFAYAYEKNGSKMGWPKSGKIQFHEDGAENLLGFMQYVEDAGFLDLLISYGGSWSPRLIRGSSTTLSNHGHAVALDLNAPWNWLRQHPTAIGKKGTLLQIVSLAHAWGFYWGGHFNRLDGMHFELSVLRRPEHGAHFYTSLFQDRV